MYLEKDAFGGGICPKTSCDYIVFIKASLVASWI
jgi:hypothetical protein